MIRVWSGLRRARRVLTGLIAVAVLVARADAVGPQMHGVGTILGLALAIAASGRFHVWLRVGWRRAGRPRSPPPPL